MLIKEPNANAKLFLLSENARVELPNRAPECAGLGAGRADATMKSSETRTLIQFLDCRQFVGRKWKVPLGINAPLQPTCLWLATGANDSSEEGQRWLFISGEKYVEGSEFLLVQVLPVREILVEGLAALFRC